MYNNWRRPIFRVVFVCTECLELHLYVYNRLIVTSHRLSLQAFFFSFPTLCCVGPFVAVLDVNNLSIFSVYIYK